MNEQVSNKENQKFLIENRSRKLKELFSIS